MRGGPDVDHLGAQVADVQRDPVGEGEERRVEGQVAPLRVLPVGQFPGGPEGDRLGAGLSWATIVAPEKRTLPNVWSPWWWVFIRVRTGAELTDAMASRNARVRRSVEQESTADDPLRPDDERRCC